ncbi:MAG: riboflavin synthase [Gammaproteobacteria bacterium]|nr:MAG: riboflavin synthase [Gammaproteobacteria bacterium]
MFTGIIEATGTLAVLAAKGDGMRLHINTGKLDMSDVALGDSIAVNGVCLTVVDLPRNGFWADVSDETLRLTTLSSLCVGSYVNLEKAMPANGRFGGHMVSGHVDGLGKIIGRQDNGRFVKFHVQVPPELSRYIAHKGSVCVDGVSLTVNSVDANRFSLTIVPHTVQETIMGHYAVGDCLNIEVDVMARYIERLLNAGEEVPLRTGVTPELLAEHGFLPQ